MFPSPTTPLPNFLLFASSMLKYYSNDFLLLAALPGFLYQSYPTNATTISECKPRHQPLHCMSTSPSRILRSFFSLRYKLSASRLNLQNLYSHKISPNSLTLLTLSLLGQSTDLLSLYMMSSVNIEHILRHPLNEELSSV